MARPFDALGVLHEPQKVYVADIPGARVKLHGGGGRQMRRFSVTMNHQSALTVDVENSKRSLRENKWYYVWALTRGGKIKTFNSLAR